ncbi:MAG: hypothetical protein ACRC1K_24440 [Planctomycetia bacterium]
MKIDTEAWDWGFMTDVARMRAKETRAAALWVLLGASTIAWAQPPAPPGAADAVGKPAAPAASVPAAPIPAAPAAAAAAKTATPPEEVPLAPKSVLLDPNVERPIAKKDEKKDEKPAKKASRRDRLLKEGIPAEPLPDFTVGKVVPVRKPDRAAEEAFEQMRKGQQPKIDRTIIDRVVQYKLFRLTAPENAGGLSRFTGEIGDDVRTARNANNEISVAFIEAYKASMMRNIGPLTTPQFSIVVRVNALRAIELVTDGNNDPPVDLEKGTGSVPIVLRVLKDPKQEDGVRYQALRTLQSIKVKNPGLISVPAEREICDVLLKFVESSSDVQQLLLEQVAMTLGSLGRAFRGDVPERAEVGTFLANVSSNEANDFRTRLEAAVSLGKLRVAQDFGGNWNVQLVGLVIARAARDLIKYHEAGQISLEAFRFQMFRLAESYTIFAKQVPNPALDGLRTAFLQEVAQPVITEKKVVPSTPLDAWIAQNTPPKKMRLTDKADLVQFKSAPAAPPAVDNAQVNDVPPKAN